MGESQGLWTVDRWKEWFSNGELVPFFQPILSVENDSIFGFEALGRFKDQNNNIHSLGPFFLSEPSHTFSPEERLRFRNLKRDVDRSIRTKALQILSENTNLPPSTKLFLNISPTFMQDYLISGSNDDPYTLKSAKTIGVDPRKIVIEIVEEHFSGEIDQLKPLINLYKREGVLVAIDDLGARSSNLDRIGALHPDIIKVDLGLIRSSVDSRNFQEILYTLSRLAESLGCSLLFEGIETETELYNALTYGARFLQGFYFAEPSPNLIDISGLSIRFSQLHELFFSYKKYQLLRRIKKERELEDRLESAGIQVSFEQEFLKIRIRNAYLLKDSVFRMYVTDQEGRQLSPNYTELSQEIMQEDESYLGRNWSWRPYFLEQFYKNAKNPSEGWIASNPYFDLDSRILLITYSRRLTDGNVLFVDVRMWDFP
ncbi:cyclic diguanylate phosphodiesterase (EAL) domain protein [Leptospira broomii serovar Hurstbridge str. 5399]|uniref:Cyclic diguanylate phosphodiesterase (EAL) domain protein n=1 Tax=Leptospira broomii serovar Hurstbridge str. 5399 TaxID=1049789 RepID=T0FG48_9LEPT|nr:EAL domain-containing protein [Leptospira broomii]EQA46911.1 cyclic diguanylate phosphodiesterase (EAL) domain protein [Leptospira broomii serovar Hurstbridge str. 5399]